MDYFKLLKERSKARGSKKFLVVNDKMYTYDKVYKDSKLLGQKINYALRENKLDGSKSKILIYCNDFYFQLVAFFASNFSDQIPVISHYNLSMKVLKKIVVMNNIQYIITDQDLDFDNRKSINISRDILDFKEVFMYEINIRNNKKVNSKVCMGALTSGSTDVPKVLFRTYESWVDFFEIQNKVFKINLDSKVFINGSLSFTGNLNVVMSVLYEGGSVVSETSFNCKKWVQTIYDELITNIYLVPTKLKLLVTFIEGPIDNVQSIFTGSQLLFENTADKLNRKFPNAEITLYYGASELNYITYLKYEEIHSKPLSVGKPFSNVDVFIKDNFIYVNSKYHVEGMKSPCTVYDVGHFDDDGYLIFDGRKDNVINKGGIKISGTKIEHEIKKMAEVSDVAVLGYDDDNKGSEIAAFIIASREITRKDVIEKLKSNLMPIEIPRRIIFIKNMPLNSSGKIDRLRLIRDNLIL